MKEEKNKATVRPQRKDGQTKKTYNGTMQGRGLTRKSGISTVDSHPVWAYRPRTRICNHPADKLNYKEADTYIGNRTSNLLACPFIFSTVHMPRDQSVKFAGKAG